MSGDVLSQPPSKPVKLEEHSPEWGRVYAAERERISGLLGPDLVQIDHIGSTAVPELIAKPIVDILASVTSLDDPDYYAAILRALGYHFVPDGGDLDRLFFRKENPDVHLHLVPKNSWTWRKHILFRDILRHDSDFRLRYSTLKRQVVGGSNGDREAYNREKAAFIEGFLDELRNDDD